MLTVYQKSAYLVILNSTMILRSIGKTFKNTDNGRTLREFKISLFKKLENLVNAIETNQFNENIILVAITELANEFDISIGQSQKAINVILKYHYYSIEINHREIKRFLHCPIDSKVLSILGINNLRLNAIDMERYIEIQNTISQIVESRIDFDYNWDRQHLEDEGLL